MSGSFGLRIVISHKQEVNFPHGFAQCKKAACGSCGFCASCLIAGSFKGFPGNVTVPGSFKGFPGSAGGGAGASQTDSQAHSVSPGTITSTSPPVSTTNSGSLAGFQPKSTTTFPSAPTSSKPNGGVGPAQSSKMQMVALGAVTTVLLHCVSLF
ncbi:hypothetical protein B0H19DRAFT_1067813 [Mycena capillaripes]|nr:hypothetical protein B0H19DRAFT_1067813 [Mycena capillaripes]